MTDPAQMSPPAAQDAEAALASLQEVTAALGSDGDGKITITPPPKTASTDPMVPPLQSPPMGAVGDDKPNDSTMSIPSSLPTSDPKPSDIPELASQPNLNDLTVPTPAPKPEQPIESLAAGTSPLPAITPDPITAPASPTPLAVPPAPLNTNDEGKSSVLEILLKDGSVSKEQADQIEVERINTGKSHEELIEEKKLVSEEALTKAKASTNGLPFIKLEETGVSPEALTQIPEGVARRYNMLPFALNKQERTLSVAMKDPMDLLAIDFAEQKSGYRLLPYYAMASELERTIAERYAQSLSSEVTQALEETKEVAAEKRQLEDLSSLSGEVVKQAPITKIVETMLAFAVKARASDIHIEPQENRTRIRYRIDGLLMEKLILPKTVHEAVVSRIKILSDLKIDEKRIPQDGRFTFFSSGEEVDLRVSTLPTIHGEKVVMRLLKKNSTVPSLSELGLRGLALRKVEDAIKVPHGIVLVTGPTGSGKTTTLYSVLHRINTPKVNIVTLEDPVEYQMAGINQVQINPQAGLSFASGLRSFLRQDPNIIMVGEIRDSETVELAVQASLTGHLVFSTLHTSSAAGALPRLVDMGAEPFLLASSMTLTMAQRVVRKLNPDYVEEYTPEPPVVEDIKQVLGDNYTSWCKQNNKDPDKMTLFRTKADRPQTEPEYKGRVAIFEVMPITEELGKLIMENKSATDLEKVAIKDGMLLMKQDGYLKALEGLTTIEEVLRVAQV